MGRFAQPREMAELRGRVRHDPQRYRDEIPKTDLPLGTPPEWLSEDVRRAWRYIEAHMPAGILRGEHRVIFEVMSTLLAEFWRSPTEIPVGKLQALLACCARFGMSPGDAKATSRARANEPESVFAQYATR